MSPTADWTERFQSLVWAGRRRIANRWTHVHGKARPSRPAETLPLLLSVSCVQVGADVPIPVNARHKTTGSGAIPQIFLVEYGFHYVLFPFDEKVPDGVQAEVIAVEMETATVEGGENA